MEQMVCVFVGSTLEELPYLCDARNKHFRAVLDRLLVELSELYKKNYRVFVVDITPGLGLLWAELILDFKRTCQDESIKLICTPLDDEVVVSWHEIWRERYFDVLSESSIGHAEDQMNANEERDCKNMIFIIH